MIAKKRVCVIGGGISGLSAAWMLSRHPDRFEVELWEKNDHLGGNAMTVEIPQDDGTSIPIDISVTAYIPTAYHNYVNLLDRYSIKSLPTRFNYAVRYGEATYAHDLDSELKRTLQPEIDRFQDLLCRIRRFARYAETTNRFKAALNPYNYISMGRLLALNGFSMEFLVKIVKPMFVNFVLASGVFDMPASMFTRYLDFFDIERSTPMTTWDQGTANLYSHMARELSGPVFLGRAVEKIIRRGGVVTVRDQSGKEERFDEVILACNANQALLLLEHPTRMESFLLSAVRYESELHNHAIVHTDASVLPVDETKAMETRSTYVEQYGARPDNYEITYIMHNQQPWANASDKPCLVTYNPVHPIDEAKVVKRWWFQHVVHDVRHVTVLMNLFQFIQGRRNTHFCGAHTTVNSQEHGLMSGMLCAWQLGADYPFPHDVVARNWFVFWGKTMFGLRFRRAR
ncbi:FAD-dependent oxidoreductase [Streptomyces sp. RP5T]|uniref:FAD-dependent oxidoreductase n=1 Tax=Streptomyces sp. RP5T TaxID=2490848 RepID=UPI000F653DB0|nr:FAD-dependent oxidoreductase [Streptomyces sp. RP5T]RRR86557.1 FAD-dependent oxidoreductase [Streptomyces sp. RP5T]